MKQKEAMRQDKRRMPVDHPPRKLGTQRTLVFNHKSKVFTSFGIVNFTVLSDECTEDTSHASFFLRIKSIHIKQMLGWLTAARELRCTITTKNPEHTGPWVSLQHRQTDNLLLQGLFCLKAMDFLNSRCKYTT